MNVNLLRKALPCGSPIGLTRKGQPIFIIRGGDDTAPPATIETTDPATMSLDAIDAEIPILVARAAVLDAIETPSAEDNAEADALIARHTALEAVRTPMVARAASIARIKDAALDPANVERAFHVPNVNIKKDPFENVEALKNVSPDNEDLIARAVTAMSEVRSFGTTDRDRESVVRAIETIPGAATHALVYGSPVYRSAFQRWGQAAAQGQAPLYSAEEADIVRTALSLSGANGGYMLPTLFDPTLIKTGTAVKDNLRAVSRVETISQNVWHGVSVGNVTAYWTAEASAFTDGSPTFSNPSVTAAKLTAYLPGSYEIFEDMSQMSQLPGLIAEGMSYVEQTAFISGSGSGAPKGIITAISATAGSTVTVTTRGSFTSASSADVYGLVNAVTPRYEDTLTWVGNKKTFNIINTMAPQGGGSLYWKDLNSPATNRPPLLGSPTLGASDMDTAYASGTAFLILGDFSQFLIVDRIGTTVEFVQNVFNSTPLPTGQRALVCHKRVGSDCTDINAFRFLKA